MIEFTIYEWCGWIITLSISFMMGYFWCGFKILNYIIEQIEKGNIKIKK